MFSHRSTVGPAVAGTWYPADPGELARLVDGYLQPEAEADGPPGRVRGLIEPHAGYVYSGAVAGRGFRRLRGATPRRVLLLGPSHYHALPGVALPRAGAYRTPLGEVPVDREVVDRLAERDGFEVTDVPFAPEHSLEAELPFLQRVLGSEWSVVPVLVGPEATGDRAQRLADDLRPWVGPDVPVIVSSDFTHYGPRFAYVPFRSDVPARLRELDLGAIRHIEEGDARGFRDYVDRTGATICGRNPVEIALRLLGGDDVRGVVIDYDTSGRLTGDWEHSVSYAAVVLLEPATHTD